MKRIEWAIAAILLSSTFFGPALAIEQAGVTAAVHGEVNLDPVTGEVAHAALSGEDVFLGDGLSSGDASGLQLMLLDETIFTVGANTDLTVDEFVYDPATGAGQMSASLTKGIFRFVTGSIAQGDPEDMVINLPTGFIGIRGTTGLVGLISPALAALVLPDATFDPAGGDVTVAVLLETTNNLGMTATLNGVSRDLTAPGFGIGSQGAAPPSFPSRTANVGLLLDNVSPAAPPTGGPGAPLDDSSGRGGGLFDLGDLGGPSLGPPTGPPDPPPPINDDILRPDFGSFPTAGSGSFNIVEAPFTQTKKLGNDVNILGHFHAFFSINFNSRTLSGSIQVDTVFDGNGGNLQDGSNDGSGSFGPYPLTGPAVINFSDPIASFSSTYQNSIISFSDEAESLVLKVIYDDGPNVGNGSGVSDPPSPM